MARFYHDRCGTAAIEFALVAPVLVLLVLGLADAVRQILAAMDVDTAASAGAMAALAGGEAGRIDAAIDAQDVTVRRVVEHLACERPRQSGFCAGLPAGRYTRVAVESTVSSLFGGRVAVAAVAIVRVP